MAKVKVAVYGTTGRVVILDSNANKGAQIGQDLLMPDGSVATLAALAAALDALTPSTSGGTGAISHSTLAGLTLGDDHPQYVRKDTLTTNGDMYVRVGGVVARLPIGQVGTVLTARNGIPVWESLRLTPGPPGEDGMDGDHGPPGERGLTGLTGLTGATGSVGIPGEDGMDGDHGPPGERGPQGTAGVGTVGPPGAPIPGEDGMDGDHGPPGERGLTGAIGATGPAGFPIPGEDGMDGDHGPPGERGLTGGIGAQGGLGPPGEDGMDGDHGPPGERGLTGAAGTAGAAGTPGTPGEDGMDGDHGPPGERGLQGVPGATGPMGAILPGEDGMDGDHGPPGERGPTGSAGANGTLGAPGEDGMDGDHGPPGERGLQGVTGATGPMGALLPGEDGMDGDHGPPGERGLTGGVGTQGPPGPPGEDGADGDPGPPGKDGASGGGGTPGGSPTQLQYNLASAFAGVAGSAVTAAGALTLAPTAGVALTLNLFAGQFGLVISGDGNSQYMMQLNSSSATSGRNAINFLNSGAVTRNWAVGVDTGGTSTGDFSFRNITAATLPLTIKASNGAVTIAAPAAAGVALTLNGIAGSTTLNVLPADSASVGIRVLDPGANATDARINTTNSQVNIQALGTSTKLNLQGGAGVITTTPTVASSVGLDLAAGNGAATLRIAAGTTTVQPLQLTSGTNLTSATQGAYEYDGTALYFTPGVSSRGVDLVEYIQVQSGTHTLVSQTAAQALLNVTANGAVTLPIGTYEFECFFQLSAMSTSSGAFGFALGGAATFTQTWWADADKAAPATASAAATTTVNTTASNVAISPTSVSATGWARIHGVIRVTVAGTVIPQISLGVAAAAIVAVNSFFRCRVLGGSSFNTIGNWS